MGRVREVRPGDACLYGLEMHDDVDKWRGRRKKAAYASNVVVALLARWGPYKLVPESFKVGLNYYVRVELPDLYTDSCPGKVVMVDVKYPTTDQPFTYIHDVELNRYRVFASIPGYEVYIYNAVIMRSINVGELAMGAIKRAVPKYIPDSRGSGQPYYKLPNTIFNIPGVPYHHGQIPYLPRELWLSDKVVQ